jgi:hypothetical protein
MRELRFKSDVSPNHDRRAGLQNLRLGRKGETVKVYNATYHSSKNGDAKVIPVAAASLQHAARKAEKESDKHGELVEVKLSKDIII